MVNQTSRLDVHEQQIFQLQKEVAEIKTSLKLLQEERSASIAFRKSVLDWMKKQDKQFVEAQSESFGIILSDSKTSFGSEDGSVDWQMLQLPEFSGSKIPRDIQKVSLNLGTHSTYDALATNVEEMILLNPSNNSDFYNGDFLGPFEATNIWGQLMPKPGGSSPSYDRQSTPLLKKPYSFSANRS
ncbi:hypothetical protein R6Q59_015947 [Mikania micrantha]